MAKQTVYVETSVLSFLCADPSTVQKTFEKQRDTVEWWGAYRQRFEAFVSDVVAAEAAMGHPTFAQRRLEKADQLPLLTAERDDRQLALEFVARGLIPRKAEVDGTHLAIAVRTGMDFLLTWNLKHLANPETLPLVYNYLKAVGRHIPRIVTPAALLELM